MIVEETVNLNLSEVEVVILQTDNSTEIETEIKSSENQTNKKVNKPIEEEKAQLPHDGAKEFRI